MLNDERVRAAYDAPAPEFELAAEMIRGGDRQPASG
jgi:hypothetical protein